MRKEGLKRSPTVSVMVELATDSRRIVEDKRDMCLRKIDWQRKKKAPRSMRVF